jgi:exopolysaccharide production protein ExoQ
MMRRPPSFIESGGDAPDAERAAMPIPPIRRAAPSAPPGGAIPWILTVISMVLLPLNARLGSAAIGVFVVIWLGYIAAWPAHAGRALGKQTLIWIFPAVAVASTLWSIAPDETLRHSIQLVLTTIIAIVMARSVSKEKFVAALVCTLVPMLLLGAAFGDTQLTETGEVASRGIFGSKNFFALHISLMLFASVGVLLSARQPVWVRLVAVLGLIAGPLLLVYARSVGALVTAVPCVMVLLATVAVRLVRKDMKPIAIAGYGTVLAVLLILVLIAISTDKNMILSAVGKDSDLTGRDYLWYRASFLIHQRPTLGVGYQAFWIQGNLDAEGLWRAEHIAARSGFHFHSYYYGTVVELGYLGFTLVTFQFVTMALGVLFAGLRRPSGEAAFFSAIIVFYALRAPIELDFTFPFGLTPILLPAAWIYALPGAGWLRDRRRRPRRAVAAA